MAAYYHASDKFDELCEWYDGYRFGDTDIFNPWSVINYFSIGCKPRAFWQSTGSNDIISEVIAKADEDIYERLEKLLQGEKFTTLIDTGVIYPQIQKNPSTIYSFLLVAGYLKAENMNVSSSGDFMGEVSLPNRESGKGRFDIQLMPRDTARPGVLIELKVGKYGMRDELGALAQKALDQINDRKYDTEMRTKGVEVIFKYGVAFCRKEVAVCTG